MHQPAVRVVYLQDELIHEIKVFDRERPESRPLRSFNIYLHCNTLMSEVMTVYDIL